jgi:glycerol-3-phosphate acyltransferase PlsY
MAVAVFITHRANIARILKGEEPRIGKSKPA